MYEFREKKKFRKFVYSNFALGLLLILVVLAGRGAWNMYSKERQAAIGREEVERQVALLEARERFLSREVERLKTENGVEREIRDTFNVKKPGEEVAVIVDSTTTVSEDGRGPSITDRIWGWFRGIGGQ